MTESNLRPCLFDFKAILFHFIASNRFLKIPTILFIPKDFNRKNKFEEILYFGWNWKWFCFLHSKIASSMKYCIEFNYNGMGGTPSYKMPVTTILEPWTMQRQTYPFDTNSPETAENRPVPPVLLTSQRGFTAFEQITGWNRCLRFPLNQIPGR